MIEAKPTIFMISKLKLTNFRSHKNLELTLTKSNLIIGKNGAGKTNILESIALMSYCRSFREEDKKNLINLENDYSRINIEDLEMFLGKVPRFCLRTRKNGVSVKLANFVGLIPSVILSPESISIITGSPRERRRFLDIMISQVNREYLLDLIEYKKVQKQRNSLLEKINQREAGQDELTFWNEQFIKISNKITKQRHEAIKYVDAGISRIYQDVSGRKEDDLKIDYLKNYEGELGEWLGRNQAREIGAKLTLFGAHRDDMIFILNNMKMNNYASRGELKSAILALKMMELDYLKDKKKTLRETNKLAIEPVLLLDDIFSEFDEKRKNHLSKLILQYQSVITATEIENIPKELVDKANIIKL